MIFFVLIVGASVLAGVPISIAFAVSTFAYMVLTTDVPMMLFVGRFYEGMSHLILLAVPLFVFLGLLIEMTGMARAMVAFLASLLGHIRGGLSYVLVGAMYLVSGISGSKAADMAAVAPALFPEMIKRGAKPGELVALLAATGAQTETVPPSLVLPPLSAVVVLLHAANAMRRPAILVAFICLSFSSDMLPAPSGASARSCGENIRQCRRRRHTPGSASSKSITDAAAEPSSDCCSAWHVTRASV